MRQELLADEALARLHASHCADGVAGPAVLDDRLARHAAPAVIPEIAEAGVAS